MSTNLRKIIVVITQDELGELLDASLNEILGIDSPLWSEADREISFSGDCLKVKIRSPMLPKDFETPESHFIARVGLERMRIIASKANRGQRWP